MPGADAATAAVFSGTWAVTATMPRASETTCGCLRSAFSIGRRGYLTDLHLRNDVGALWENLCVNERMKHNHYTGWMVNPWFWRTCDQKELDFVEESGGQFAGLEFKWGLGAARQAGGGSARGARAFQAVYPGSTVEVIEPGNVWDFAGVPMKGAQP